MGTSNLQVYNGRYRGELLTEQQCKNLETIIEMDKNNQGLDEYTNLIYNIPNDKVEEFINSRERKKPAPIEFKDKPQGTLRPDQTLGVAFMYESNRCIIGDSVGMGKTVETAGLIQKCKLEYAKQKKSFRYCVFTQNNLTTQFRQQLVKFTGDYVVLLQDAQNNKLQKFYNNNPYTDNNTTSVVGPHSLITAPIFIMWLEQYKAVHNEYPFDLFIVDESSVLGGDSTNKIVSTFERLIKNVPRVIFLNATPFETSLMIFYNQLNLLDPTSMPTKKDFEDNFVEMDYRGLFPTPTGKYKNAEDFKQYIGYRYFARTRKDKGAEMKDCDGGIIMSPLSKIQKQLLQRTTMYRMIYDCPQYLDPDIEFNETNVPKLKSLREILNTKCNGEQVIIFVPYIEAQDSIKEWLIAQGYSVDVLNGKVKAKEREIVINRFKNNEVNILITNVQKGLNFGNCNYCIFYSFDTNPSKMLQFEGRITRDFDIINKNIYILCSEGKEESTLNEIVQERTKATTNFTNADISVILKILSGGHRGDLE